MAMVNDEEYIEKLIRRNRNEFTEDPPENHLKRFLKKMNSRMGHLISIVPHLIKVTIITIALFIASIIGFRYFIIKDPAFIKLQVKIVTTVTKMVRPG